MFVEAPSRRADLSRQAAGQLGSAFQTAISGSGSASGRGEGPFLALQISIEGCRAVHHRRHDARPETMLGDTAVAVHPDDGSATPISSANSRSCRWSAAASDRRGRLFRSGGHRHGQDHPAHDFNDFEVGKRHGLAINILDRKAHIALSGNETFWADTGHQRRARRGAGAGRRRGGDAGLRLRRGDARGAAPHRQGARGGAQDRRGGDGSARAAREGQAQHPRGAARRSLNVVIEPFLTDQWYVNAGNWRSRRSPPCATDGPVSSPKNWENTYCTSGWRTSSRGACRASVVGSHQIPAWYGPDGRSSSPLTKPKALDATIHHYLTRAEDPDATKAADLRQRREAGFLTRDEDDTRHVVLTPRRCGRSRRAGLAGANAGAGATIRPRFSSPASTSSSSGSPA